MGCHLFEGDALDFGLPLALAVLTFIVGMAWHFWRANKLKKQGITSPNSPRGRMVALGGLSSFTALIVSLVTGYGVFTFVNWLNNI